MRGGRVSGLTGAPRSRLYRDVSASPSEGVRPILVVAALLISAAFVYIAWRQNGNEPWLYAVAVAGLFVARGLHLHRPITLGHATGAVLLVAIADIGYRGGHEAIGFVLLAGSGAILMLPTNSRPQPAHLCRVAGLVDRTVDDPLAPFAMHSTKSYYFNAAGTAAVGYRSRMGMAVVAGDPIGNADDFEALIAEFTDFARSRGWRITVLGAGERCTKLWQATGSQKLRAVSIGRDVVIDIGEFDLHGRKFRNLRQAVSRTRNFGVTTEIEWETALADDTRTELLALVDDWHSGRQNRGFSMILDHLLDGRHPGMLVILARDVNGRLVGFQRYGTSAGGRELSIDVPWRAKDAPNGIDERMIVDLVDHVRPLGAQRVSLAFAAFPDLFTQTERSLGAQICYNLVHLGDPLLNLESLYRFLRKFHALADQRYVLLRWSELVPAAIALLTLEFVPHRREY